MFAENGYDMRDFNHHMSQVVDQESCSKCWSVCLTQSMQDILRSVNLLSKDNTLSYDTFAREATNSKDACVKAPKFRIAVQMSIAKGFVCNFKSMRYYPSMYRKLTHIDQVKTNIINGIPPVCIIEMYEGLSFQQYKRGIFGVPEWRDTCVKKTGLKRYHSMCIIGWGTTDDQIPYWIVRNSWGRQWGMDGYAYILATFNCCGIEEDVYVINI